MKKNFISIIVILGIFLLSAAALAKIAVPGRTDKWLNDYADIINEPTRQHLENLISSIKQKTPDRIEIIVTTFNSLEGWQPRDFALAYGEKWRLSKKGRDNGVILLVVFQERYVTIGVGQNLKGILTDGVINGIIRESILPLFRKGDYGEGIKQGVQVIINILDNAEIPADNPIFNSRNALIAILAIILLMLIRQFSSQRQKKKSAS